MSAKNLRKDKWFGKLYDEEIALAREVFEDTLPYERIFISNTKTHTQGITLATSPNRKRSKYLLLWSNAYRTNIAEATEKMKQTFIHELAHVWQGQYSGRTSMSYMSNSMWNQISYGVRDIFKGGFGSGSKRVGEMIKKGLVQEWDHHRNKAYSFPFERIGEDFRTFNVEQQAIIIESWFMKYSFELNGIEYPAGLQSEDDARFPYVRDCIRMRNVNASYIGNKRY